VSIGIQKDPPPIVVQKAPLSLRLVPIVRGGFLWTHRRKPLGEVLEASVPAEALRRLDNLEFGEVEITDCRQRIGGGAVVQAGRQSLQPSGVLALQHG
jgi:hypothetical protein